MSDSLQQERAGAGPLTASVVPTNGEISNRLGDNTRGEIEVKKKKKFCFSRDNFPQKGGGIISSAADEPNQQTGKQSRATSGVKWASLVTAG